MPHKIQNQKRDIQSAANETFAADFFLLYMRKILFSAHTIVTEEAKRSIAHDLYRNF